MIARFALAFVFATLPVLGVSAQEGPNRPEPKPVTLDGKTSAVLVLDLNARCDDPKSTCSKLTPGVGEFLEKVRAAAVPIIYTVSASAKGKPIGELAAPLKRKKKETIIYPNAFDKFIRNELQTLLKEKETKTLIITGASTNAAMLYTATTTARIYRYNIVMPMDGVIADRKYEQEYSFHQFTVLPGEANKQFQFTNLSMVTFR